MPRKLTKDADKMRIRRINLDLRNEFDLVLKYMDPQMKGNPRESRLRERFSKGTGTQQRRWGFRCRRWRCA